MIKSRMSLAIAAVMLVGGTTTAVAGDSIVGARTTEAAPQGGMSQAVGQRFVVKYRQPQLSADKQASAALLNSAVARAGLNRTLVANRTSAARPAVSASVLRKMATPGWQVVRTSRALSAAESADFIRELSADPSVAVVEADQLYQHLAIDAPAAAPNDPNYAQYQWNFFNAAGGVRAEQAWDVSTGEGVVVAVIDTGVTQGTLDLASAILPGYDMISDALISRRATDDRAPGGWDLGDYVPADYCVQVGAPPHAARNSSWHGTHVSGTVAQETNNGSGLAGIAHGAKVVPVRVLGSCGGFGADISDGMIWAAGGEVEGLPLNANPAEILNMSLGSSGPASCPAIYQDAIDQINAMGAIIVVAAGNAGADAATYTMSSCSGVISVGATGIAGGKAGYSNYGARIDLSAPGGGGGVDGNPNGYVWQVINGGAQTAVPGNWVLGGKAGTSMSSPHVAAGAALVQSALSALGRDPLDWAQMRDLLTSTARPFPVSIPTATPMGAGILDLEALLAAATEEPCTEDCAPPATPIVNLVPVRGLGGVADSETLYSVEVPAGVTGPLSITTSGGSGDVSLHVSLDEAPAAAGTWNSTRPGNAETIRINAPAAGVYYIKLVGVRAYSNVTLQARFILPPV
ncbi:MAG: S8 family serine peptidase [Luteimonas sp.]